MRTGIPKIENFLVSNDKEYCTLADIPTVAWSNLHISTFLIWCPKSFTAVLCFPRLQIQSCGRKPHMPYHKKMMLILVSSGPRDETGEIWGPSKDSIELGYFGTTFADYSDHAVRQYGLEHRMGP